MIKQMTHLKFPNGSYHGEVTGPEPVRHGMGQMNFNDGSSYQGQWMNDKKNGHGIFYFFSGNVYQGYFVNNKKEGYGEFFYAESQDYYKGYWMNDKKHGQGEYFFSNGDRFKGFFVQDIKHGPGVKISKNLRYEGVWDNNQKNGSFEFVNLKTGKQGIIYYRNNKKVGIQTARQSLPVDETPVDAGYRAGERLNVNMPAFSNYTHSYESPTCQRQPSHKLSISNMQEKPADFPGEVGRQALGQPPFLEVPGYGVSQRVPVERMAQGGQPGPLENPVPGPVQTKQGLPLMKNSNISSLEMGPDKLNENPSVSKSEDRLEIPQNSIAKQLQSIPNIKDTKSFKSYDSRTIKTTSQGTFNSSAKTNMKAFYDYKEFKEGMSNGNVNLKLMEEDPSKQPQLPLQTGPMRLEPGPMENALLNIESMSMERQDVMPRVSGDMHIQGRPHGVSDHMGPLGGYTGMRGPPMFQNQYNLQGAYRGHMANGDPRSGANKLAQIEESPELNFGAKAFGMQGFDPRFGS